eukprot:scaffold935_cov155-Amphora_coffeaeformis.AAC.13
MTDLTDATKAASSDPTMTTATRGCVGPYPMISTRSKALRIDKRKLLCCDCDDATACDDGAAWWGAGDEDEDANKANNMSGHMQATVSKRRALSDSEDRGCRRLVVVSSSGSYASMLVNELM